MFKKIKAPTVTIRAYYSKGIFTDVIFKDSSGFTFAVTQYVNAGEILLYIEGKNVDVTKIVNRHNILNYQFWKRIALQERPSPTET